MVLCPGAWKNFEELEDNLTLAELDQILSSARQVQREQNKFIAALKGIDLDKNEGTQEDAFLKVKMRAEAKARGIDEETYELGMVGIEVQEWGEE